MTEPQVSASRLADGPINVMVRIDPELAMVLTPEHSPVLGDLVRFAALDAVGRDPLDWFAAAAVGADPAFRKLEGDG